MKTFALLAAALMLAGVACREKPVDVGALVTARTVGLEHLQRGQLAEAEQDFRRVIALAPREPLGHANLGLTYLRAGRYDDAEAQLALARRLDATNPEVALILAKLYALTGRPAEAQRLLGTVTPDARVWYALAELERARADTAYVARLRRVLEKSPANLAVRLKLADAFVGMGQADSAVQYLEDVRRVPPAPPVEAKPYVDRAIQALRAENLSDARAAFGRLLQLMEVTAPYQASLAQVDWVEGPLPGRPVFEFNPATLITMRGIAPASNVDVRFTDVTAESGLPTLRTPVTALALADYDGDGEDNLLLAAPDAHVYTVHGGFVADITAKAALPLPSGLIATEFADYDNDGWLDLFAIGTNGRGYLLKNQGGKRFEDVTETSGVRDVDGARRGLFVDVDHDGDLDLLLVGGGSLAVFRNNLDGTFSLFPQADGIVRGGNDAAFGDFNDDGRIDVAVASANGGDALFYNAGVPGFKDSGIALRSRSSAVAVGDSNNDGILDVFWSPSAFAAFVDYDNDGWLDRIVAGSGGVALYHNDGRGGFEDRSRVLPPAVQHDTITQLLIADLDRDGDQDILLGTRSGVHLLRNDGGNARLGMRVELTALGMGSGKNNAFGIGSMLQVRAGELYQTRVVTAPVTSFGLGSHFKADVLRVQWPNGVPQTIYFPGTDQDVLEAQQLKGSCAFLYTWDGTQFRFITDIMWRSALGMPLGIMGRGEAGSGKGNAMAYAPAGASLEYVRIPGEALQPKNGRYVMQVTEELWETAYIDQLRLLAVDHPDSVEVYVDERFPPIRGPELKLFSVVGRRPPISAVDERGVDVLAELRGHDYRYVSNLTPARYQGLTEPHSITLDLDEHAGDLGTLLILRGWIFPSDASINVALSQQRRLKSEMPVLQVQDARGQWVSRGTIGFPAGKDKTMVIDLAGIFPTKDRHVRIRTSMQVYWDEAFVGETAGGSGNERGVKTTTLAPTSAELHYRGFSRMYRRGGRYGPHWFDYGEVTRESPWRSITGAATRFGDVRPLLEQSDDQYVVMVPGDETTVEFDAAARQTPDSGWKRTFFLYSDGWIKDSDLNTAHGTTVEPLPYHALNSYPYGPEDSYPPDTARQRYLRTYNTRIVKRGASKGH